MFGRSRKRERILEQELLPHLDSLFRYALHLTRKPDQAEELTQDTLTKAVTHFDKYKPGTNARAWLFRIMLNHYINQRRARRPEVPFVEGVEPRAYEGDLGERMVRAQADPESEVLSQLAIEEIRQAIDALPEDFRAVVVLADLEEFSYREIADMLSCPIGTVMSRLHRGRRLLRERLLDLAGQLGVVPEQPPETEVKDMGEVMASLDAYRRRKGAAAPGGPGLE